MMKVKGYIFDYGGTLDTGGCHWGRLMWKAYQQAGVPVSEALFREAYVYAERTLGRTPLIEPSFTFLQTLELKVQLQFEYLSPAVADSSQAAVVRWLYDTARQHVTESRTVLQQLPQPKVLVTNFYGNMATVLREFQLAELFSTVVESAAVGVRKPDSRMFSLGVEALRLQPSEVVVVGDSLEKDILPARKIGCRTVWLQGEQWGKQADDQLVADRTIHQLSELLAGR